MIEIENGVTVITPDAGFQYVTNGEVFTDLVKLGKDDRAENWQNTNEEPPQEPIEGVSI